MALEAVKLDDLTWREMVLAIRRRIAAASGGNWTLHAPVDPGVTLLELFAWLLEQRLYWMDQTPDSLARAALTLLGEGPHPTRSASTVLRISSELSFKTVPAESEMRLLRQQSLLIFKTDKGLTILPVERIGLHFANEDRTPDLENGRVIRLFPADGGEAEIRIVLWLKEEIPAAATGEPFSLLFDLRTSASIKPQWIQDETVKVEPPAELSWLYRNSSGQQVEFKSIDDGTGGLRRTGAVRLSLPTDWKPDAPAANPGEPTPYSLWIRVQKSSFTYPPRLERLIPNVVIARHLRQTEEHHLQRKWLSLPGNMITLSELPENHPIKDHPPLETDVKLQIKERDDKWYEWTPVSDLSFYGPGDRHFIVDRERGVLMFGDGLTGRLPVLAKTDDTNMTVKYFVGGGSDGNVGENLDWEGNKDKALTARNVVPAEGGREPEAIESARQRAASSIRQRLRAITRGDYEEIARTTPGIAIMRARAAIGLHPSHPCVPVPGAVTVFIVPDAPREDVDEDFVERAFVAAPLPDPGALSAVSKRLDEARLVTTEVFVRAPRYVKVALTVTVESNAEDTVALRERVTERLQRFLDPLVGGDSGQGWPFGEPLRPSALLREVQRALDQGGDAIAVSIKLVDRDDPAEDCRDVLIGPHDLVALQDVQVQFRRFAASAPGQGGLR